MKRIVLLHKILIITALAGGCRKVDLEPVDGTPVFMASAKFDGAPHQWRAGVDDFYMFSSFEKDALSVYEFSGSFAKKDSCCGEVFTIRIRDLQQVGQGLPEIEAALAQDLFFASQTGIDTLWKTIQDTTGWSTTFNASGSILPNTPVNYVWSYGDGKSDTLNQQTTTHFYDALPSQPVTLTVRALNNTCSSSISKLLNLNTNSSPCGLNLNLQFLNPNNPNGGVQVTAQPTGNQPFTYSWSNGTAGSFITIPDTNGIIGASVTVTDATGCVVSSTVNTTLGLGTTLLPICIAKFSNTPVVPQTVNVQVIDSLIIGDSLQFSKVKIEYTDASGEFYSSFLGPQDNTAHIKILDVEAYEVNEKGEKTKKVSLEFDCRLWNEEGQFIGVSAGKAVIAVSYP